LEASAIPDSSQIIHSLARAKTEFKKGVAFLRENELVSSVNSKYAALLLN